MKSEYSEIFDRAKPYLDTRNNEIHVKVVCNYAERLLESFPNADESVVMPAAILHDVGWKMIPEKDQLKAFGPTIKDTNLLRVHEVEGVRIANEILKEVNYDAEKIEEILNIIEGHDSRLTALSLNDELMKDSDKLWRFSKTGIEIDHRRFEKELGKYIAWLQCKIPDWFFSSAGEEMAKESIHEAKQLLII